MTLRPMTMADADKMLEWKNYPETRKYSILTPDEITKEDHYAWLEKNLDGFKVILNRRTGVVVGAIRVVDDQVSIWIDQAFRKLGKATWILQHHAQRGMTAKIVDGNIGSMRAFIRAGFLPVSYATVERRNIGYYNLQKCY